MDWIPQAATPADAVTTGKLEAGHRTGGPFAGCGVVPRLTGPRPSRRLCACEPRGDLLAAVERLQDPRRWRRPAGRYRGLGRTFAVRVLNRMRASRSNCPGLLAFPRRRHLILYQYRSGERI